MRINRKEWRGTHVENLDVNQLLTWVDNAHDMMIGAEHNLCSIIQRAYLGGASMEQMSKRTGMTYGSVRSIVRSLIDG